MSPRTRMGRVEGRRGCGGGGAWITPGAVGLGVFPREEEGEEVVGVGEGRCWRGNGGVFVGGSGGGIWIWRLFGRIDGIGSGGGEGRGREGGGGVGCRSGDGSFRLGREGMGGKER